MVARSNVIYQLAGGVSMVVAIVARPPRFAATIAIVERHKKVLPTRPCPLGYMFWPRVWARTRRRSSCHEPRLFKALLSRSGSVIHAWAASRPAEDGGLKTHLPTRAHLFHRRAGHRGCRAGRFSQGRDPAHAAAGGYWPCVRSILTAALTAVYMFRSYYLTFQGTSAARMAGASPARSPPIMTTALRAAAGPSWGPVGIPGSPFGFLPRTCSAISSSRCGGRREPRLHHIPPAGRGSSAAPPSSRRRMAAGAPHLWRDAGSPRTSLRGSPARRAADARHKYYVDELYDASVIRGFWATARSLFRFDAGFIDGFLVNGVRNVTVEFLSLLSGLFDKFVVDGLVNGVGSTLAWGSRQFRRLQTGFVSNYALVLGAGMFALVCAFLLLRMR